MHPLFQEIQKNCLVDPTIESCGLVLETSKGLVVENCKNISETPKSHFLISPSEQREKEKTGKLVGFYHSHISNSDFSWLDKAVSEATKLICFLYKIPTEELSEYHPNGWKAPYLGRPFVPQVFDSYELVRDYYKKELNILLPKTINKSLDYLIENGFQQVNKPKLHDIVVITQKDIDSLDYSVYLGSDRILHHYDGSDSQNNVYGRVFKKLTVCVLRHRSQV